MKEMEIMAAQNNVSAPIQTETFCTGVGSVPADFDKILDTYFGIELVSYTFDYEIANLCSPC